MFGGFCLLFLFLPRSVFSRLSGCGVFLFGQLSLTEWFLFGEFDPGSGRTLAACLTHASRTMKPLGGLVANG